MFLHGDLLSLPATPKFLSSLLPSPPLLPESLCLPLSFLRSAFFFHCMGCSGRREALLHRLHVYLGLMVHRKRGTRLTCQLYMKLHRGFPSPPATSSAIPLWSSLDPNVAFLHPWPCRSSPYPAGTRNKPRCISNVRQRKEMERMLSALASIALQI